MLAEECLRRDGQLQVHNYLKKSTNEDIDNVSDLWGLNQAEWTVFLNKPEPISKKEFIQKCAPRILSADDRFQGEFDIPCIKYYVDILLSKQSDIRFLYHHV